MRRLALIAAVAAAAGGCGDDGEPDAADAGPPDAAPPAAGCDPDAPGTICTIAGNGLNGYDGDQDIAALEARMSLPMDTLAMADGSIFVLDWNNHRVRLLGTDGVLRHFAGRGELGGTLDDPANSDFNHPTALLLSEDGQTLYVAAWHNSKVRQIDIATREIVDTCGDGRRAYFGDGDPDGPIALDLPTSLTFDPNGDLVIMDQANQTIRRLDRDGIIHRVAGMCVVSAENLPEPTDVEPIACPGGSGKWAKGDPAAVCGLKCRPSYAATDDPLTMRMAQTGSDPQHADPGGRIAYDADGNLFFADTVNQLIRKITTNGTVEIIAGVAPVDGVIQNGTSPDGTVATEALLSAPTDLAVAPDGTVYFSDVANNCVRRVASDGKVYTVAGVCGERGFAGDGGAPEAALLKMPYGIELAGSRLFISDAGNHRIRVVNLP